MHLDKSKSSLFIGVAFLSLSRFLCAACGSIGSSTTASGGTTNATPTATCPPNRFKTTTGTCKVSLALLCLSTAPRDSVQASYATTTRIQREATVATSALKEGTFVTVAVKQDTSGNYTATRITLVANRAGGFGGGTGNVAQVDLVGTGGTGVDLVVEQVVHGTGRTRNANCFRQGGANGGAFGGGAGAGGTTSANTLTGTTGQLSGSTLTITDLQGSNYTVTLDAATQIVQFQSATASALKNGASITLTGSANSKGVITAQRYYDLTSYQRMASTA